MASRRNRTRALAPSTSPTHPRSLHNPGVTGINPKYFASASVFLPVSGLKARHFWFFLLLISLSRYHLAFSKSSICLLLIKLFSPARQMYFIAFPRQKLKCSATIIHSTPEG